MFGPWFVQKQLEGRIQIMVLILASQWITWARFFSIKAATRKAADGSCIARAFSTKKATEKLRWLAQFGSPLGCLVTRAAALRLTGPSAYARRDCQGLRLTAASKLQV